MIARALTAAVAVALIAAGCGGSAGPSLSETIHVDGKHAQGDYVFETDASGAQFLVPTAFAGQGSRAFDLAAPTKSGAGDVTIAPLPYRAVVASATAVVPHAAHVEVLATGQPGRRFALSWEETCGWAQEGKAAVGGTGGQGSEILRSPAVTLVKLPRTSGGVASCYIAATASTSTFSGHMRLMIIDY